jgi:hypothetical protein
MAVELGTGVVTAARVGKAFVLRKSRQVAQRIRVNTGGKEGGAQSSPESTLANDTREGGLCFAHVLVLGVSLAYKITKGGSGVLNTAGTQG